MPRRPRPIIWMVNITLEDDGRLQSLNSETGAALDGAQSKLSASIGTIDTLLYIVSEEGLCYVIRVRDDGCEIISEIPMEEETLATPAIVDNTIYLRTRHNLWKIRKVE